MYKEVFGLGMKKGTGLNQMKHSGFTTAIKMRIGRTFVNEDMFVTHAVKCRVSAFKLLGWIKSRDER